MSLPLETMACEAFPKAELLAPELTGARSGCIRNPRTAERSGCTPAEPYPLNRRPEYGCSGSRPSEKPYSTDKNLRRLFPVRQRMPNYSNRWRLFSLRQQAMPNRKNVVPTKPEDYLARLVRNRIIGRARCPHRNTVRAKLVAEALQFDDGGGAAQGKAKF